MTEKEKINKVADKVTEYTTATMHNQGLISYNDIPKLATEIVKNLGLFSVSGSWIDFIHYHPENEHDCKVWRNTLTEKWYYDHELAEIIGTDKVEALKLNYR